MLLNAGVPWNLAAKERVKRGKLVLKRHQFMMSVAQSMMDCEDSEEVKEPPQLAWKFVVA
jgi:hypothetical protein